MRQWNVEIWSSDRRTRPTFDCGHSLHKSWDWRRSPGEGSKDETSFGKFQQRSGKEGSARGRQRERGCLPVTSQLREDSSEKGGTDPLWPVLLLAKKEESPLDGQHGGHRQLC